MHLLTISAISLVLVKFSLGATLPKTHHQPPLVQYHWTPQDLKLREMLYGYQREVATCNKENVGELFYELSVFNLKPLVTPLRDTVEQVLRQASGLMIKNNWYPSFTEACSRILVTTTAPCVCQKCPDLQCPSVDCPRQTCTACPPAREETVCLPLWPYLTFGIFLGVSCCVLLLIGWCSVAAVVRRCKRTATEATSASLDSSIQLANIPCSPVPATPLMTGRSVRAPLGTRSSNRGLPLPPPPPPPAAGHAPRQEVVLPVEYEELPIASSPPVPVVEPEVVQYVARPTADNLLEELRGVPRFQSLGRDSVIYDSTPLVQKRN